MKYLFTLGAPTDVLRGVINGSRVSYNSSISKCDNILSVELIGNLKKTQNITLSIFQPESFYSVVDNLFDLSLVTTRIASQLHPIAQNCWKGGYEVYYHFFNLIINVNGWNIKPYLLNFVYNFGHMYDSGRDIVMFMT